MKHGKPVTPPLHPVTGAQRQQKLRARGRPIANVLQDDEAIAALDVLAKHYGSQRLALERALTREARLIRRRRPSCIA